MPKSDPSTPYINQLAAGVQTSVNYTGTNDTFQGTIDIAQAISGSPGALVGSNTISVTGDNAASAYEIKYLRVTASIGGANFLGYRTAISGKLSHDTASPALATALAAGGTYNAVGVLALATSAVNLGGVGGSTAPANNNWCGSFTAGNSNVFMLSGATNLRMVCGHEIDVQVPSGSSTRQKIGLLMAKTTGDAGQGAASDAGIAFGDQTGVTAAWQYGLSFAVDWAPWSFGTGSTLIGAIPTGIASSYTANLGIDFSNITFTTAPIKLPGGVLVLSGSGAPAVAAPVGSLYLRTDGGAGTTLYVKESGTGTSGWVGK